jgi:hypothetical protein
MAQLVQESNSLIVVLSFWERLGAVHGDLVIPNEHVVSYEFVEDLWEHLRGVRAPGTGFPGKIMLGTTRFRGGKDFCAVYKHRPGYVIDLRNEDFQRILITTSCVDLG